MKHNKTVILGISIILAILITLGVAWWGHAHSHNTTTPKPTTTTATRKPTPQPTTTQPTNPELTSKKQQAAITYEQTARNWGTDPTQAMDTKHALQDTWQVLNPLRAPKELNRSQLDALGTVQFDPDWGPNAPSVLCEGAGSAGQCNAYPTMLAYWRANEWLMGARTNNVRAQMVDDSTVKVTGDVQVVLWSFPYEAIQARGKHTQWWGFSPKSGTVPFVSTLTVDDNGKVTKRETDTTASLWIADPWFHSWNSNPADSNQQWDNSKQINIPLHGERPDSWTMEGMNPDLNQPMLENSIEQDDALWKDTGYNTWDELPK